MLLASKVAGVGRDVFVGWTNFVGLCFFYCHNKWVFVSGSTHMSQAHVNRVLPSFVQLGMCSDVTRSCMCGNM
jgi:hypothetical protein